MPPAQADVAALYAEERAAVASAVESRRREFAAGRILARRLLGELGSEAPLGRRPDGLPAWPAGVIGSIAHCADLAAAAVCRIEACAGLGIDLEPRTPLPADVAALVLTSPGEREIAAADPYGGLRVFCAKEAFYKAVYPSIRRIIDFDAVEIAAAPHATGFVAQLRIGVSPFGPNAAFAGRWAMSTSHVAAALVISTRSLGATPS